MKKMILSFLLFCFAHLPAQQEIHDGTVPPRPSPPRLVNNLSQQFPSFLTADQESSLEQKLEDFSRQTSNQVVIVIVDDLGGTDAASFATQIGETWGVGQKKFDNGVVILVKPTGGENERDVYIAVGYGLEGVIPDITAKHIVDREIIPAFKNDDYYGGLNAATDVIMKLAKGEYNSSDYVNDRYGLQPWHIAVIILIILFIIFFIIPWRFRGGGGGGGFFIGGGGWGSSGGGFGGGGFGGGGFGGFGGGGFGGGGAGGKW